MGTLHVGTLEYAGNLSDALEAAGIYPTPNTENPNTTCGRAYAQEVDWNTD